MVGVRHLNLAFGEGEKHDQVLYGVSFHVESGEIYGLIGESSSGRTTVFKCLTGLFTHWQGKPTIDTRPLGHGISREYHRQVQMVLQDPYGSPYLRHTIGDILEELLQIHRINDRGQRINVLLDKIGLNYAFRKHYPHQPSGGQRQRVVTARALVLGPRVLLLDEPTSVLDMSVQAKILNLLTELQWEARLTYLMVTYDLGVIVRLCQKVVVIQCGEVLKTLTAGALISGQVQTTYTQMLINASWQHTHEMAREAVGY